MKFKLTSFVQDLRTGLFQDRGYDTIESMRLHIRVKEVIKLKSSSEV